MGLDFYQIYYKDEQKKQLYDFSIAHKNEGLTHWFENEVIKNLVPQSQADYIGVASWRLKQKREMGLCPFILKDTSLTKDKILSQEADIMNLRPFKQGHQALMMAKNWHGPAWEIGLNSLKKIIKVPSEITTPIYENHFITRREIYHDYVKCLSETIDYMADKMDVFGADSGYLTKLHREPERVREYQQKTGRKDWPIGVFLLERLFSIWIEGKNFKIINV